MTISWAVVAAARRAPRGRCRASRAAAATRPIARAPKCTTTNAKHRHFVWGGVLGGSPPYPEPSPLRLGRVTGLRNPTTPTLLARKRRRGRPPGTRLSPLQQGGGRGACLSSTQERAKASALAHLAPGAQAGPQRGQISLGASAPRRAAASRRARFGAAAAPPHLAQRSTDTAPKISQALNANITTARPVLGLAHPGAAVWPPPRPRPVPAFACVSPGG